MESQSGIQNLGAGIKELRRRGHGGDIEISDSPQGGARFSVHLPTSI